MLIRRIIPVFTERTAFHNVAVEFDRNHFTGLDFIIVPSGPITIFALQCGQDVFEPVDVLIIVPQYGHCTVTLIKTSPL